MSRRSKRSRRPLPPRRTAIDVYLIATRDAAVSTTVLPLIRDSAKDFAGMYAAPGSASYDVRPDGHVSFASSRIASDELVAHLSSTSGAGVSTTAMPDLR